MSSITLREFCDFLVAEFEGLQPTVARVACGCHWTAVEPGCVKTPSRDSNFVENGRSQPSLLAIFLLLIDLRPRKLIDLLQWRDLRSVVTQPKANADLKKRRC